MGEVDNKGMACGRGSAIGTDSRKIEYSGTFLDDQMHGICIEKWQGYWYEGERRYGMSHGCSTMYTKM